MLTGRPVGRSEQARVRMRSPLKHAHTLGHSMLDLTTHPIGGSFTAQS
jgi:hypothetical protein